MAQILIHDRKATKAYAETWCRAGNDCPDGQFSGIEGGIINTDCTHFISHALLAGGVRVPGDGIAQCKSGLSYRVKELEAWFAAGVAKYANVKRIDWVQAGADDFVFLEGFRWRDLEFSVTHVMLVGGPVDSQGSVVFGHSNERCGKEHIDYDAASKARFYRIEPSPLDGAWRSTDPDSRFGLNISGREVVFAEYKRGSPTPFKKTVTLVSDDGGSLVLRREVDDPLLQFLDFPSASLRAAILAKHPDPSTLTLTWADDAPAGVWRGLLVRKKPDGTLQEVVPSASVPPKSFGFRRA